MNILITNAVLGNTGDAAIAAGIVAAIERQADGRELVFSIHDSDARTTSHLFPDWRVFQQPTFTPPGGTRAWRVLRMIMVVAASVAAVRSSLMRRLLLGPLFRRSGLGQGLSRISAADVVVSSGGTYLVDHYRFRSRVIELELAAAMGKPVILWTQSMGPFRTPAAERLARRVAACSTAIFFRDQRSMDNLSRVAALPEVATVVADSAFSLARADGPIPEVAEQKVALISVRSWGQSIDGDELDPHQYRDSIRQAATALISLGWRCIAISTCQGIEAYRTDDSIVAKEVFDGLPVEIDTEYHTPAELLSYIAGADLIISTRMHLAILALISQIPVVALAYEFKTTELYRGLGLGADTRELDALDGRWLSDAAIRVHASGPQLSESDLAQLRDQADIPALHIVGNQTGATGLPA